MSASQQELAIERDKERLRLKAEANVIRNLRFRDARWRTIGIDEQALREQVKEKERLRELEKEEARLDRLRNEEYDRILQAAADEEAYLRKLQDEEVRRHWKDQMDAKQRPREPEEPTTFTIGYEDPFEKDRVKEQKKQMARWSQEQALQQKQRKNSEKEQDLAYADMLKAIDDIRGQAEEEEARLRAEMIRKLRDDNLALAEQQRKKKMAERDPFTGEDAQNNTLLLWTAHGGGKESFRGFDEAKRKAILSENEKLKAFRDDMKRREKELDDAWHQEQLIAAQAMIAADQEERQLRDMLKQQQRDMLRDQMEDRKRREQREKMDRDEPIGDGFFDGFGVIWR